MASEAGELTVGTPELQVTVRCEGDVWAVAKAAFEAAEKAANDYSSFRFPLVRNETSEGKYGAKSEQVREIVRRLLSDGRLHRRRDLSKAVREAGLNPNGLTKMLEGHFERHENADGVFYRDPQADPSPTNEVPVYRIGELIPASGGGNGSNGDER